MRFSLAASLVFGVAQIAIGLALAVHGSTRGRWRRPGAYIALLAGVWFVCSGIAELLVSGMEALRSAIQHPSELTFLTVRERADGALFVVTAVLAALALLYPLVRLRARHDATQALVTSDADQRHQRHQRQGGTRDERARNARPHR